MYHVKKKKERKKEQQTKTNRRNIAFYIVYFLMGALFAQRRTQRSTFLSLVLIKHQVL